MIGYVSGGVILFVSVLVVFVVFFGGFGLFVLDLKYFVW